jgi:predicted nucleic acid-binding protein
MRVLFDTSVLVAALVEGHAAHSRAFPWLAGVKDGVHTGVVVSHTLAELYAVLTRLPMPRPVAPSSARALIERDVLRQFSVVSLSRQDYVSVLDHMAAAGIAGGAIYDALLLEGAKKTGADRVLTLNESHFKRVFPELADRIAAP